MREDRNTNSSKRGRSFGTGDEIWPVTEDHVDMVPEGIAPKMITMSREDSHADLRTTVGGADPAS